MRFFTVLIFIFFSLCFQTATRSINISGNCIIGSISYPNDDLSVNQLNNKGFSTKIEQIQANSQINLSGNLELDKVELLSNENNFIKIGGDSSIIEIGNEIINFNLGYSEGKKNILYLNNLKEPSVNIVETPLKSQIHIYDNDNLPEKFNEDIINSGKEGHYIVIDDKDKTPSIILKQKESDIELNINTTKLDVVYEANSNISTNLNASNGEYSFILNDPNLYSDSKGLCLKSGKKDSVYDINLINSKIKSVISKINCNINISCTENSNCQTETTTNIIEINDESLNNLNITKIDMSGTGLKSNIPPGFFAALKKTNVSELIMKENELQGLISNDICSLLPIASIDLSKNNHLIGGIPKCDNEKIDKKLNISCTSINTKKYEGTVNLIKDCSGYIVENECIEVCGSDYVSSKLFTYLQDGINYNEDKYPIAGEYDTSKRGNIYMLPSGETFIIDSIYYTQNCKILYKLVDSNGNLIGDSYLYVEDTSVGDICKNDGSYKNFDEIKINSEEINIEATIDGIKQKIILDFTIIGSINTNLEKNEIEAKVIVATTLNKNKVNLISDLTSYTFNNSLPKFTKVVKIEIVKSSINNITCTLDSLDLTKSSCSGNLKIEVTLNDITGKTYIFSGKYDFDKQELKLNINTPSATFEGELFKIFELQNRIVYKYVLQFLTTINQIELNKWPILEKIPLNVSIETKIPTDIDYFYSDILTFNNIFYSLVIGKDSQGYISRFEINSNNDVVAKPVYNWFLSDKNFVNIDNIVEEKGGNLKKSIRSIEFFDKTIENGFDLYIVSKGKGNKIITVIIRFDKNGKTKISATENTYDADSDSDTVIKNEGGTVIISQGNNTTTIDINKLPKPSDDLNIGVIPGSEENYLCGWYQSPSFDDLSMFTGCKINSIGIGIFIGIGLLCIIIIIIGVTVPMIKKSKKILQKKLKDKLPQPLPNLSSKSDTKTETLTKNINFQNVKKTKDSTYITPLKKANIDINTKSDQSIKLKPVAINVLPPIAKTNPNNNNSMYNFPKINRFGNRFNDFNSNTSMNETSVISVISSKTSSDKSHTEPIKFKLVQTNTMGYINRYAF